MYLILTILQSVLSSFLYIGAATVSPLIEKIIPYGKRFGTRKFCFQHTGFNDFCVNLRTNSDDFPILLQMALQPGVGLGLHYNMPPGLSVPCSISPFVYTHLSQVHGHVIQPSHSWSPSSSCCIQLSVQHLFLGLQCLAFFLYAQAILFFGT